jgi:hypothetical protein
MKNYSNDIYFPERIFSSLNRSKSKAAYSFSHAPRFPNNNKLDYSFSFYNLPSQKSHRSTCLGYGKRFSIDNNNDDKCQNIYNIPSTFALKYHNAPQYTFGRKYKINKNYKNNTPGPIYNCRKRFGRDAPFFSLGVKFNNKTIDYYPSPGPSDYYNENNHILGMSYLSNLQNSKNVTLKLSEKRFKYIKNNYPGPGQYYLPKLINSTGNIFESKYKSIPAKSFLGSRNFSNKKLKENTPGPGQYSYFSQFDGYKNYSSNKEIKE